MMTTMRYVFAVLVASCQLAYGVEPGTCDASAQAALARTPERYLACVRQWADPLAATGATSSVLADVIGTVDAISTIAPNATLARAAGTAGQALKQSGRLRPADEADLIEIALDNGWIDQAAELHASGNAASVKAMRWPKFRAHPRPPGATASYWAPTEGGNALEERFVDLMKGAHVVVIASAGCHFCESAARWIGSDPALQRLFRDHSLWISRPDPTFGAQEAEDWSRAFAATPVNTVLDVQGWPMPKIWATPQFIFMRDGKALATVGGWTDRSPVGIRDGFREIGVTEVGQVEASSWKTSHGACANADNEALLMDRMLMVMAPIRSHSDLDHYLANHDIEKTPLAWLTPPARKRFLDSLSFTPGMGANTFAFKDLDAELTLSQAYGVLALVGMQQGIKGLKNARIETPQDRELARLLIPGTTVAR